MKGISSKTGSISAKLGLRRRHSQAPSRHSGKFRGIPYSRLGIRFSREASIRCLALPFPLDVTYFVAAASGAAVALAAEQLIHTLRQKPAPFESKEEDADLEARLTEMEAAWKVDRERVKVLEGARAAAVKDVMTALGEKRDVDFALVEAKEEIHRLQQTKAPTKEDREKTIKEVLDDLPKEVKTKLDAEAVQKLKMWLLSALQDRFIVGSSEDDDLWSSTSIVEKLKVELENEKGKVAEAYIESATIKEFAQSELQSMTNHLIQIREEANIIKQERSDLESEVGQLKLLLEQLQAVIKDLKGQLYAHKMRAEAAYMVEVIEDKAYENLQKALKKSRSAQQTALREVLETAKAKDREQKLKEKLEDAQKKIKEKSLEVRYLTELIQILSSKEAQERAEEQTLNQYFPPEDTV